MRSKNTVKFQIEQKGYSIVDGFDLHELEIVKEIVRKSIIQRITKAGYPYSLIKKFTDIPLYEYHLYSHDLDHSALWKRSDRTLSPKDASSFMQLHFFSKLEEIFPLFRISDEDNIGHPNFVWRLVRPNASGSDIGPPHRDLWFWELNDTFPVPDYPYHRLKVWMPLETESARTGFAVEEASHLRRDIKYDSQSLDGIIKPRIKQDTKLNLKLLDIKPGQAVIFHDSLIHAGYSNGASQSRLSIEYTLFIKQEKIND